VAVLLWDNHTSHNLDQDLLKLYSDIRVLFLPPNLTSHHQPLDAGIIAATKLKYKTVMLQMLDDLVEHWEERRKSAENNKSGLNGLLQGHYAHLGDAVLITQQAWDVITDETIKNCWIKANCLPATLEQQLMATSEKGRAKLAARAAAANSTVTAMATDDDEGWEVMDSGQLDFSQLQEALDSLSINITTKRPQLVGGNGAIFPVLQDAVYSAAAVDVQDADRTTAAKTITCLEEDAEVVEKLGNLLLKELDEQDRQAPEAPMDHDGAAAADRSVESVASIEPTQSPEEVFARLRAGRAVAEGWLHDLAQQAGSNDEVEALMAASKIFLTQRRRFKSRFMRFSSGSRRRKFSQSLSERFTWFSHGFGGSGMRLFYIIIFSVVL